VLAAGARSWLADTSHRALVAFALACSLGVAPALAQDDPLVARADAQAELAALRVRYGEGHPAVVEARARAEALAHATTPDPCGARSALVARSVSVDEELASARARYGDSHPTIRALEGRRAAYPAALAAAPSCSR
jgi:uncharacterized protein involved in exopolysaccharide biosynthesis